MNTLKFTSPIRKWSLGRGYYALLIPIPSFIKEKMNLKPGEIVEVIIRKVRPEDLEEEFSNVKNVEQK